jgi:hypothetical protein
VSSGPYVFCESDDRSPGAADHAKSVKVLSEEMNVFCDRVARRNFQI